MLEIVLATSNPGKIREFQHMLAELPIKLIPQTELKLRDVAEIGLTFIENAILKARHACALTGMPAIADDSGLVVDVLNGAPGVRSARYAGKNSDDRARINKLLLELEDIQDEERTASFHCVTVLLESERDPAPLICEGIWDGLILREPVGDQGFGYDPIFFVPEFERSAAELSLAEKNSVSHRGQALKQLFEALEGLRDTE